MKTLFVSQPMEGLEDIEILEARFSAQNDAEKIVGEPLRLAASYFNLGDETPVQNLAKGIVMLADADCVYFCRGWEKSIGCKIEHDIAVEYGIKIIRD